MTTLLPLPPGRITIRHRQMRGVWQCFVGRTYINGASGDCPAAAAQSLASQYEVRPNTKATVHGLKYPFDLVINPSE